MEFLKANIEAGKVYVCLVAELSTRKITSATWTRCGLRPETPCCFFRTADVNVNCQLPPIVTALAVR